MPRIFTIRPTALHQIKRLIGKVPSIAAMSYRHSVGFPYVYPDNDLSYTENFMNMLWKMVEPKYVANPVTGARARHSVHPACRPRAELQHQRDARRWAVRQADPYSRRRRRLLLWPVRCTAAPTKKF